MPKITNEKVIEILQHPYFDQHTAMHLARERLTLPDGTKLPLILPPCLCGTCSDDVPKTDATGMPDMGGDGMDSGGMPDMIEAGEPGSGKQLLEMHHEMIRVFRFLLCHDNPPLRFLAEWPADPNQPQRQWTRPKDPDDTCYAPELWDLDDPGKLPHEVVGMLKVTDPEYLTLAFGGVKELIEPSDDEIDEAVDKLGRFIEQGVKSGKPDGSGLHETMHEYLASREGMAAQGAEMNRLNVSRFNDYFWSLHLWIDAQYGRLLEKRQQPFDTSELDPATIMDKMCTAAASPAKAAVAGMP